MNPIAAMLARQGLVVLDGALATELEARGAVLDPLLWSAGLLIESPELIRQLHLDYLRAGADCIISASYQATVEGFTRRGLSQQEARRLLQRSVSLALAARDDFWADTAARKGRARPLVAASIGPYGAFLADGSEYRGEYGIREQELEEFHRPRWQVLAASGADLLACETVPSATEARALARLLRQTDRQYAFFSFQARDGQRIGDGSELAEIVAELEPVEQIVAIGVNCTAPRCVADLIRILRQESSKPIVVYPNSGEVWDGNQKCWRSGNGDGPDFIELAARWHALGARLIGGCCRTTPETIRRLRQQLLPRAGQDRERLDR